MKKLEKIVITIYSNKDTNLRMSFGRWIFFAFGAIVTAPYFLLGYQWSIGNLKDPQAFIAPSSHTIVQKIIPLVVKSPSNIQAPKKISVINNVSDVVVAKQSSLDKSSDFKIVNFKHTITGNNVAVDFLLTRTHLNGKINAGEVFIEALDGQGEIVGRSSSSRFKFQTSRLSNFRLAMQKVAEIHKIRVKLVDASTQAQQVINLNL